MSGETHSSLPPKPPLEAGPPPPRQNSRWLPACLIGCLGGFLVLALLCAGGTWYTVRNAPRLGADLTRSTLTQFVENSELKPEDKRAVIAQIDRVAAKYKRGEITLEQVTQIGEEIMQGPLMVLLMALAAEEQYLNASGLSAEEKAAAKRTVQRVGRGVVEKKITEEELDPLLDHVSTKGANGQRAFAEKLTDEQLRQFLTEAKALVDAKGIPDEPYQVDVGAQLKSAVDRVLKTRERQANQVSEYAESVL